MEISELFKLEVILKTIERCNLNCSYCYFFHGKDQSYKLHPPSITEEVIRQLVDFLSQGVEELKIKQLQIDLHGGEPTLQKKASFDQMCSLFRSKLGTKCQLILAIQTNAFRLDKEWIDLFSKHDIHVGVSLDGPEHINDKHRVDHKGRGSHKGVVEGIHQLQSAAEQKRLREPSLLCVINPDNDAKELYRYFVHELGISSMDFLLPDQTHDTMGKESVPKYGKFLTDLFSAWAEDDNPAINVRILNSALNLFLGKSSQLMGFGRSSKHVQAFTISSNGELSPDDSLRFGIPHMMQQSSIFSSSMKEFLNLPLMQEIREASVTSPDTCKSCCFENVCGGSHLLSRYSSVNQFNNPSVYCSALQEFYTQVLAYLLKSGVCKENIRNTLISPCQTLATV